MFEKGSTVWHESLATTLTPIGDKIDSTIEKAKKNMARTENMMVLASPLGDADYVFQKPEATGLFRDTNKISPYVITQRASAFAVESESLPSAGAPCFLTVRYGFAWVTCVPLDNVIDSGHTIETIAAYVDTKTRTFFNKLPSFGLSAGSSIFLPLGYIPLIVGIGASSSDDEENTSKYEYVSVVVQPVLCEKNLPNISPAILSELKGWFNKAISRATRIFSANEKLNKKAMEAWMADWPTKDNRAISPDHTKDFDMTQIEDLGDVD